MRETGACAQKVTHPVTAIYALFYVERFLSMPTEAASIHEVVRRKALEEARLDARALACGQGGKRAGTVGPHSGRRP